ncbi:MAG TPA: hypothetical protein VEP90_22935, partial [Methylomirabilota bacterium]|nr:hypothetical protein [Methylomirabilota bacterium]
MKNVLNVMVIIPTFGLNDTLKFVMATGRFKNDFKESSQRAFNRVCIRRKNFCRFTLWTGLCA